MRSSVLVGLVLTCFLSSALASGTSEDLAYYRQLTMSVRTQAIFKVAQLNQDQFYDYSITFGDPVFPDPVISDLPRMDQPDKYFRIFWDRIFLKDGSRLLLNGEEIPLTCVFISGQDNRQAGNLDPRFPEFVLKVYLVANDFSCVGPMNPGWPGNGGKKETWDTYAYYEIKDPTIMLPVEAKIRYRWNEFHSVLVK